MAVPKKKTSKAKSRSRRASAWQLVVAGAASCPSCGAAKRSHAVCPQCGYYRGRPAVEIQG